MIIDEIKTANIQAVKEHDHNLRAVYSVLINKYMQAQIDARVTKKQVTDDDMVRIIQKTIKELTEEAENYARVGNAQEQNNIILQRTAIEKYLPKMLTEEEVRKIILSLTDKSIPNVMRTFKTNFGSRVDMKMVSDVLKNL